MKGREEPLLNCRFRVEIDGISRSGFSEVSLSHACTEWIEYREGTHPLVLQRLAGLERFGVITLKTGVTKSLELSNWYQNFSSNPSPESRRNASIIVLNSKGEDGARFNLVNAWPAKYSVGPLEAKGKDVLYESLEIVFEGLQRVS
jgi:phage tail-like protein